VFNRYAPIVCIAVFCTFVPFIKSIHAEVLITPEEGRLPASDARRRGIFLGPTVELISPLATIGQIRSPVRLLLKFRAHGGARIDLNTLTVTYVRRPAVDITERIIKFGSSDGINMPVAEVPPGNHRIWVDVRDSRGETGFAEIQLQVSQ
jgi:hypothetical protein